MLTPVSLTYNAATEDLMFFANEGPGIGGTNTPLIAKISTAGAVIWSKYITAPSGHTLAGAQAIEDSQGNVIVVGTDTYKGDIIVASYAAADGSINWQYFHSGFFQGASLTMDGSGNIYACGFRTISPYGLFFVKFNASGTILYQEFSPDSALGGSSGNMSMVCDAAGNQYISFGTGNDLQLWKLNAGGTALFRQTFPGANSDTMLAKIVLSSDNHVFLMATGNSPSFLEEVLTYKIASNGAAVWSNSTIYNTSPGDSYPFKLVLDSSGNVEGFFNSFTNSGYLQKLNGLTGHTIWTYTFHNIAGPLDNALVYDIVPVGPNQFAIVGSAAAPSGQIGTNAFGAIMH